jgi:hypothetical protein
MRHDDICVITRTSTIKDTVTHQAKKVTDTFPAFKCRLGRTTGTIIQGQPNATLIKQARLYIMDINANIKSGDIATIGTSVYEVQEPYKPNKHHIEVDLIYRSEV